MCIYRLLLLCLVKSNVVRIDCLLLVVKMFLVL